jgi:hypothetical protein
MDAHDVAVLDRYAAASGTPRATIIGGLIASAVPELGRAAELIEMANAAPRHIRQGIVDNLSNATADALGFLAPFNADYHMAMNALQGELPIDKPTHRREGSAAVTRRVALDGTGRRKRPVDPQSLTGGSK